MGNLYFNALHPLKLFFRAALQSVAPSTQSSFFFSLIFIGVKYASWPKPLYLFWFLLSIFSFTKIFLDLFHTKSYLCICFLEDSNWHRKPKSYIKNILMLSIEATEELKISIQFLFWISKNTLKLIFLKIVSPRTRIFLLFEISIQ